MLIGGRLQNILGRKRTFLTGAGIYGVGTVVAALSINSTMLLLGWSILEGVGAALMMPATTSIISGSYDGERRAFALGITSSMASGAGTIGPIIGGFLTTYYSWRYAFGMELIIIIVIVLFSREISTFPPTLKWADLNVVGAVNSALGIFLFVIGILLLNNPKNWNIGICSIVIGVVLLIIFYFNQKSRMNHDKQPLVDVSLFKDRAFTLANITRLIMNFTNECGNFYNVFCCGETFNQNSTPLHSCHWHNGCHGWKRLPELDFQPLHYHPGYVTRNISPWSGYGHSLSSFSQCYLLCCQT